MKFFIWRRLYRLQIKPAHTSWSSRLVVLLIGGALLVGCLHTDGSMRPNIILINLDDADVDLLDPWAVDKYFPNIKRHLQDEGSRFRNFHVVIPLCAPSRNALFRGQYAHNTGILDNDTGFAGFYQNGYSDSEIGMWMKRAGYQTVLIGKYNHSKYPKAARDSNYSPPGWDKFQAFVGAQYFNFSRIIDGERIKTETGKASYRTDLETKEVTKTLARHRASKPLFVYIAPLAPHQQSANSEFGMVAPRHASEFVDVQIRRTPDFNEADMVDKPKVFERFPVAQTAAIEAADGHYRERIQSMIAVDEMVGRIFNHLEKRGLLERTYVFLTSDNGFQLLHHRMWGKKDPYDRTTRVQLLVRGPGVPSGQQYDHLLKHIDLTPTILDIAGADVPHFVDGKSFLPLLLNPTAVNEEQWQEEILIQNTEPKVSKGQPIDHAYRALRRFSDVYVEWSNGEREYYDLNKDPYQVENQWNSLTGQTRASLSADLAALARCSGQACSGGLPVDPIETTMALENDAVFTKEPIVITGAASDNDGIDRVEVVIRQVGTQRYLHGHRFRRGYRSFEAKLARPGSKRSDWSIKVSPPVGEYWISARAIDVNGNEDPAIPTAFFSVGTNDSQ